MSDSSPSDPPPARSNDGTANPSGSPSPELLRRTDAYSSHLLRPLPPGPGACLDCGTSITFESGPCWPCGSARGLPARADVLTSIGLAVKGRRFAWDLAAYKSSPDLRTREILTPLLAAIADRWLSIHESCLARAVGAGTAFDVVTVVPTRRGRREAQLAHLVGLVETSRRRYQQLLIANDELSGYPAHTPAPDLFCSLSVPPGSSVLLVEDTWATGASAQSAACALKLAGARAVGIVALGRHVRLDPRQAHRAAAERHLAESERGGWSWAECALCAVPRPASRAA